LPDVVVGGIELSSAEKKDVAKFASLDAFAKVLCAADSDDVAFAEHLVTWLRDDWSVTDRQMAKSKDPRWPYPGPISTIACALIARRAVTPVLPDDVARFVSPAVVAAARRP
jgi:hypothetical protein